MFFNNAFNIEINKYWIGVIEMRLLDQVRDVIRKKHYSIRTEQAYINWLRQHILFQGKRHPKDMGERYLRADGKAHLWQRVATYGVCSFAGQGYRL